MANTQKVGAVVKGVGISILEPIGDPLVQHHVSAPLKVGILIGTELGNSQNEPAALIAGLSIKAVTNALTYDDPATRSVGVVVKAVTTTPAAV